MPAALTRMSAGADALQSPRRVPAVVGEIDELDR